LRMLLRTPFSSGAMRILFTPLCWLAVLAERTSRWKGLDGSRVVEVVIQLKLLWTISRGWQTGRWNSFDSFGRDLLITSVFEWRTRIVGPHDDLRVTHIRLLRRLFLHQWRIRNNQHPGGKKCKQKDVQMGISWSIQMVKKG
jgi:hypothetical protein